MSFLQKLAIMFDPEKGTLARSAARLVVLVVAYFGVQMDAAQLAETMLAAEVVLQGFVQSPVGNQN